MAVDLRALLDIQRRRTRVAQDAFAAADRARQEAEAAAERALLGFQHLENSHISRREERIRAILGEPTSVVSLARVRLQYDMGEDEMRLEAEAIIALRQKAKEAADEVKIARDKLQACLKREKKLEEATNRVAIDEARIADVQAEMELER